jgi:predicted nucleotidyltransferase
MAETVEILRRLGAAGVEFVIIGGVAVAAYGAEYSTVDVDICAPLSHDNCIKIVQAFDGLNPRWLARPDFPVITASDPNLKGLKNMYLRTDLGKVDVLGELPGICSYDELAARAVEMVVLGTPCRVIDLDTLIAAKRFAGRDKDKPAVKALEVVKKYRELNPGLFDGT